METTKKEFKITDDLKANWAFVKMHDNAHKMNELKRKRQKFYDQIDEWFKSEAKSTKFSNDNLKAMLDEYRRTKPDGKIKVPAGQTVVRHTNHLIYDDDKLKNYVKINYPKLLKTTTKVDKSGLKNVVKNVDGKAVDSNGQIVDGLTFEPKESINFKLSK